jgi:DNA-binding transcriptional LysR family regulator
MLELRQLRSFLAVAERLSFARASETLHLSQPALSAQIQNLEAELGVQLFERNRRMVRLTDAGTVFVAEARATLDRAQQAADRARLAASGDLGTLNIGFVSSAALEILPEIVASFRKRHPEVRLNLINLRTVSQVSGLLDESMDIGFLRLPLAHPKLKITVIHREPFAAILPHDHPLVHAKRFSVAQLADEPFIVYGRQWAPGFFDSVMHICTGYGFSPQIAQETGEMYTAISLVAAGLGVAILPRSVVLAQSSNVVAKALPISAGVSEIALATRAKESSALVKEFIASAQTWGRSQHRFSSSK